MGLHLWPSVLQTWQTPPQQSQAQLSNRRPPPQGSSPEPLGRGEKCMCPAGTRLLKFFSTTHQLKPSVLRLFGEETVKSGEKGPGIRGLPFKKPGDQVPPKASLQTFLFLLRLPSYLMWHQMMLAFGGEEDYFNNKHSLVRIPTTYIVIYLLDDLLHHK